MDWLKFSAWIALPAAAGFLFAWFKLAASTESVRLILKNTPGGDDPAVRLTARSIVRRHIIMRLSVALMFAMVGAVAGALVRALL